MCLLHVRAADQQDTELRVHDRLGVDQPARAAGRHPGPAGRAPRPGVCQRAREGLVHDLVPAVEHQAPGRWVGDQHRRPARRVGPVIGEPLPALPVPGPGVVADAPGPVVPAVEDDLGRRRVPRHGRCQPRAGPLLPLSRSTGCRPTPRSPRRPQRGGHRRRARPRPARSRSRPRRSCAPAAPRSRRPRAPRPCRPTARAPSTCRPQRPRAGPSAAAPRRRTGPAGARGRRRAQGRPLWPQRSLVTAPARMTLRRRRHRCPRVRCRRLRTPRRDPQPELPGGAGPAPRAAACDHAASQPSAGSRSTR